MGCESALGLGNGNENAQIECECSIWFMWMLKLTYVNAHSWFIYLSLWFLLHFKCECSNQPNIIYIINALGNGNGNSIKYQFDLCD